MAINITEIGKKINLTDSENINGKMETDIKVCGNKD